MIAGLVSGVADLGKDNDARLQRLRTALALGTGFQLVIVEAEPGPIRHEVIRRIQTWSAHEAIGALAIVTLGGEAPLAVQLQVGAGAIVTGLEPPHPGEAPARDWVAELNWARDALPALVPGPMILVVSQAMHRALFERASDLYTWRRHTAHVTVTAPELALPLSSPADPYYLQERERLLHVLAAACSVFERAVAIANLGSVAFELGDEPGASRRYHEARALAGGLSHDQAESFVRVFCTLGLAECAIVRRDFAAARSLLDRVQPAARLEGRDADCALVRGKLLAAEGAWDTALVELGRATGTALLSPSPQHLAGVVEYCAQMWLARGDLVELRGSSAILIDITGGFADTWGPAVLVRLAGAVGNLYPDDSAPLLDAAFAAAEVSSARERETKIAIELLRVQRAWLLGRFAEVNERLARSRSRIRADDPPEVHASLAIYQALASSEADDDLAPRLAGARDACRGAAPRQAARAGLLLGACERRRMRPDLAVAAFQLAAQDARAAGDGALVAEAELGELGTAVDGGLERDDTCDLLQRIADERQRTGRTQSEAIAQAALGRCLRRRGLTGAAAVALARARAGFEATADLAGERVVARELADLERREDEPAGGSR